MSIMPRTYGREVVRVLTKIGYEQDRQLGSHIILRQLRQVASPRRRHHRGQIVTLARELGQPFPTDVSDGLSNWSKRAREVQIKT